MRWSLAVTAAAAFLVAGCVGGGSDGSGQRRAEPEKSPAPTTSTPETSPSHTPEGEPAARGLVVKTAGSDFGTMLFNRGDQAIYLFDKEQTSKPECYGACAAAWPPVLTKGDPQPRGQVRKGLLGTTERRDGTTQVTYGGHPLYYYAHEGPNQVLCHNVAEYGGLWLVVQPDGGPAPA